MRNGVKITGRLWHRTACALYPCFSPRSSSLLVIEATCEESETNTSAAETGGQFETLKSSVANDIRLLQQGLDMECPVIILLKSLTSTGFKGIENTLPVFKGLFSLPPDATSEEEKVFALDGFHPVSSEASNTSQLSIPIEWKLFSDELLNSVVGGKGTGKSTFARYICNRLLSKYKKIAYLDCDVGQPEFSPMGFVSLHIISSPVLGPPFTHLQNPKKSFYIGQASPKSCPDFYSACVCELYSDYLMTVSNGDCIPLVINTDGWIKGMGLDLLMHFLCFSRPRFIAQLDVGGSPVNSKNIQLELPSALAGAYGDIPLELRRIKGFEEDSQRASKVNAADLRILNLLYYFSSCYLKCGGFRQAIEKRLDLLWNFEHPFLWQYPYEVSFDSVAFVFSTEVPTSQALYALNGMIVGLGRVDDPSFDLCAGKGSDGRSTMIYSSFDRLHPKNISCVGLGIVRAIDVAKRVLYLCTPIPESTLQTVNLLIRGSAAEFPVTLALSGFEGTLKGLPYLTYMSVDGPGVAARRLRS
ncbi:Pre-mRNA cleavage complex II protein Clp1-domain-containing protein [Chytridium lagenaria]|nr:Pre-mRNA cleavage complex II protein Clp1-domain-containing protein [Chytridium lagenaria]